MKTLPRAAQWIYVLFLVPQLLKWGEVRAAKKQSLDEWGRKRTDILNYNKELSKQITRPYINHAEALGDLPTDTEQSSAPLRLPYKF